MLEAVGRFAWDGPYLPELMAQTLFALIPPWAFTPLIRLFGYNAKYHAFAGMVAVEVGALALVGTWLRRRWRGRLPRLEAAAAVVVLTVLVLVGLLPLLDAGVAGSALPAGVVLTIATVAVVAGCYVTVLTWNVES